MAFRCLPPVAHDAPEPLLLCRTIHDVHGNHVNFVKFLYGLLDLGLRRLLSRPKKHTVPLPPRRVAFSVTHGFLMINEFMEIYV